MTAWTPWKKNQDVWNLNTNFSVSLCLPSQLILRKRGQMIARSAGVACQEILNVII